MTVRLRGHHLLCMLTYIGKGYSPAFVVNYDTIAGRLSRGEDILLVNGPDDICQPLLCDYDCHCFNASVTMRDNQALKAVSALLRKQLTAGSTLHLDAHDLEKMRTAFTAGAIRSACNNCEWSDLCTEICTTDNYSGTKISIE